MVQMIVIYKMPKNPAAFARHYFEVHRPLARLAGRTAPLALPHACKTIELPGAGVTQDR
jgi:uncharacterized protein (TIGR02118 family)